MVYKITKKILLLAVFCLKKILFCIFFNVH